MPFVILEFHGIPVHEVHDRKYSAIRLYILSIEKHLLSIHSRRYTAVTKQIASFIEASYNPSQVVVYPNPTGFLDYRDKARSFIQNKVLSDDCAGQFQRSLNINILFLGSNLSQPWQGLDIASNTIKRFCQTYPEIKVSLHVYGDNISLDLANQLKAESQSTANYAIHLKPSKLDLDYNFYQQFDVSLAPCALTRKNLASSSSLKTRTCLANGIPVVSNYPDDAFSFSSMTPLIIKKATYFFRYSTIEEFSLVLLHISNIKIIYPVTYNARVLFFAKRYLDITPSSLISEFL
jgi:hypothetical protein